MQPVGPKLRIIGRLHRDVGDLVQADIVGVVEEAAARAGQVDEQVRVQHALRPTAGVPTAGVLPPKKEVCGFSAEAASLNSGPMSCQMRMPGCRAREESPEPIRNRSRRAHRRRAGRSLTLLGAFSDQVCPARTWKPRSVRSNSRLSLAHPRIERVGRDRVRGLRRAFEIDFAITREVRVRTDIPLREQRETGLPRREARFRRVEVLALRERHEVVDRTRVGSEVTGAIDAGEIDPAAKGQCDALVADLSGRAGIERRRRGLVADLRRSGDLRPGLERFLLARLDPRSDVRAASS